MLDSLLYFMFSFFAIVVISVYSHAKGGHKRSITSKVIGVHYKIFDRNSSFQTSSFKMEYGNLTGSTSDLKLQLNSI